MQHHLRLLCELAAVLGAQLGEGHDQVAPHSVASTLQARSAPACASCVSDKIASTVDHKGRSKHPGRQCSIQTKQKIVEKQCMIHMRHFHAGRKQ